MKKSSQRPSIILDAGYISIKAYDRYRSLNIIGLHGKKLYCILSIIFILFFISLINLTFLTWLMLILNLSPFNIINSKVFHIDQINQQIDIYQQTTFQDAIYTTTMKDDFSLMNISSNRQMDIYGDFNSIFIDDNQIAMNTEYFHFNNNSLVDFTNLHTFEFNSNKKTKFHFDRIKCEYIHNRYLDIWTEKNLSIIDVNQILFSGQNLSITMNRNYPHSEICFQGNKQEKISFNNYHHRRKNHLNFQISTIYLDLPRKKSKRNTYVHQSEVYRICICNTTFLLLRSFAHQPCPLC